MASPSRLRPEQRADDVNELILSLGSRNDGGSWV